MQKPTQTTDPAVPFYPIPEISEFAPITVREGITPEAVVAAPEPNPFLDGLVAGIKWAFLFVPGAAAVHFLMMGIALMFFYYDWSAQPVLGAIGGAIVSTFMIMLGVGKLRELKYLKVVAAIFGAAALAAICYSVSILFIPGDFLGWFLWLTFPLTILSGQIVKRKVDREDTTDSE